MTVRELIGRLETVSDKDMQVEVEDGLDPSDPDRVTNVVVVQSRLHEGMVVQIMS